MVSEVLFTNSGTHRLENGSPALLWVLYGNRPWLMAQYGVTCARSGHIEGGERHFLHGDRCMEEVITWEDLPRFMAEIRVLARDLLRREWHAESLQTTALVLTALRRQP